MGKLLIVVGLLVALIGVAVQLGVPLGRLPGDLVVRRGNSTFYVPIVTCIVISVILSLVLWLFRR